MTALPPDPRHPAADDTALRALYLQAQEAMSVGITARLHRARHEALTSTAAPRRRWAWPVAAGFAAVFALAVGVQTLQAPPGEAGPDETANAPLAAAENAVLDEGAADAVAAYDESPDFYLWLAANEATLLAME